jgi:hypothetical protein
MDLYNIERSKFAFGCDKGGGRNNYFVLFVMFLEIGFALWQ